MTIKHAFATSLALLALTASSCGGDDSEPAGSTGQGSGAPAKAEATVDIEDFKFVPEAVKVKAGGTVTFANADGAKHNAQTDGGSKGAFQTKDLLEGDSDEATFDKPGSYSYYCVYHRFMTGTVEVSQ